MRNAPGWGTTVAVVKIEKERICVTHVGDNRVYHWHQGVFDPVNRRISTLVAELVRNGGITRRTGQESSAKACFDQSLRDSYGNQGGVCWKVFNRRWEIGSYSARWAHGDAFPR